MRRPPEYFEAARDEASRLWDQLERYPKLAAPWHQLFKQVQSPRHVVSELLQNADDAAAREVSICIKQGVFVFKHNGKDFTEEDFESLCRFGYSNKRVLHTIGFRGVGFKSTFSLGDRVELVTPTLAVLFDRRRFTEPRWLEEDLQLDGKTQIRVAITNKKREGALEENLEEWNKTPASLIFFHHIRRFRIDDRELGWLRTGVGPVPHSLWLTRQGADNKKVLLIRSEERAFPREAQEEIRQERLLPGDEEELDLPAVTIDLVLGLLGTLYVVLPAGVKTDLPFAINGPFVQDPARLKIKDPELSVTNRWLLEEAGRCATGALLAWLGRRDMELADRAGAYCLLPSLKHSDDPLGESCAALVRKTMEENLRGKAILLAYDGRLVRMGEAVIVPDWAADVWPEEEVALLLDERRRPAVSCHVREKDRLLEWQLAQRYSDEDLERALTTKSARRPASWRQLLELWAHLAPEITRPWGSNIDPQQLRIVPIEGSSGLCPAAEVVRLAKDRFLKNDRDWEFLSPHLKVIDRDWIEYLEERADKPSSETTQAARAVLRALGLEKATGADMVIDRVAAALFTGPRVKLASAVHLARIAATMNVSVRKNFRFVTRDIRLRNPNEAPVIVDVDGTLEELVPEHLRDGLLLHPAYLQEFESCTRQEWQNWACSERSGLRTFVALEEHVQRIYGRNRVDDEARGRGLKGELWLHYVTSDFELADWDFPEEYWNHWQALATGDAKTWRQIAERILLQPSAHWKEAMQVSIRQIATTGTRRDVTEERLVPSWILRLRELPCLPDTRGFVHTPLSLFRRTRETEALLDVEPFVDYRLDTEATRPLLDLLGVQTTPTGPEKILERLRALARAGRPPLSELEKWYRSLDKLLDTGSTESRESIRNAFGSEKLIWSEDGMWQAADSVFLSAYEDEVPGAPVVWSAVRHLDLWIQVGVSERPSVELAIGWLKGLASATKLAEQDTKRVRALLGKYPGQVWREVGHWLNLPGEWVPTDNLKYKITMQSLVPWGQLHEWLKQETADLTMVRAEVADALPFASLPTLSNHLAYWLDGSSVAVAAPEPKEWLKVVGSELERIELDDKTEEERLRLLAARLAATAWRRTPSLRVIPYLDGKPCGTPIRKEAAWLDRELYLDDLPKGKLAKVIPEEIGRVFARRDVESALGFSFDRSADDIRNYIRENFRLAALVGSTQDEAQVVSTPPEETHHAGKITLESEVDTTLPEPDGTGPQSPQPSEDEEFSEKTARRQEDHPTPPRVSIIERYALAQGFKKIKENHYVHPTGSVIIKEDGILPWVRLTGTGELVRRYWAKEHSIDKPLEVPVDVWVSLEQHPESSALILTDGQENPVEMTGQELLDLKESGKLKLFPGTYRLIMDLQDWDT